MINTFFFQMLRGKIFRGFGEFDRYWMSWMVEKIMKICVMRILQMKQN